MRTAQSLSLLLAGALGLGITPSGSLPTYVDGSRLAATGGELPRDPPQVLPAREVPLAIAGRDEPVLPYRLHASTRNIAEVAADPFVSGRLWLATGGGLVRFDSGSGQWSRWSLVDGLPEKVRSVYSDGLRVSVLMENSAAVFDPEQGRFHSFRSLGGSLFAGGVRVAGAPDAPGILWWIVAQGVIRQDRAGGWTSFPYPDPWGGVVDGLVLRGGRIAVLTLDELWELRPDTKEWRRVCDIDRLDQASPARRYSDAKLSLHALSTDDEGRTYWVASRSDGLFRVEADSGQVTWPEETRDRNCGWQRVVRHGGRLFAFGDRCLREIGRPGSLALDVGTVETIRQAIPTAGRTDDLWLATNRGLASLRLADGGLDLHLPSWSEPDGVLVSTLLAAEGRLWISQKDGGVSSLDPATGRWTTFPLLRPNQTLRRSAANGRLLVYSYGRRGRTLTWIDPKTAEEVVVPGQWENALWGSVNDIHHDAQGLWAVGSLRSGRSQGFGVQRSDGTSQILLERELSSRPESLLPDLEHPGDFLLLAKKGELLRVHAGTGEAETLRANVNAIRPAGDRYVWIQGQPNARLDLRTGSLATLDLEGRGFPDPGDPDRVWLLHPGSVALYDLTRRERLTEVALPPDFIGDQLAILGGRLWIGSWDGLLEVPLPPGTSERRP